MVLSKNWVPDVLGDECNKYEIDPWKLDPALASGGEENDLDYWDVNYNDPNWNFTYSDHPEFTTEHDTYKLYDL